MLVFLGSPLLGLESKLYCGMRGHTFTRRRVYFQTRGLGFYMTIYETLVAQ